MSMKKSMITGTCLVFGILVLFGCRSNGAGIAESILILEHSSGTSGQVAWGETALLSGKSEPAQSFTLSESATVASVRLRILNMVGSPSGVYQLQICPDDSGQPATTVLASKTKEETEIAIDAWDDWVLDTPVNLSSGQTYWIVCRTSEDLGGGDNYFELNYTTSGDEYADGELGLYEAGSWDTVTPPADLWFQLHN